jgi:hypothetical protein
MNCLVSKGKVVAVHPMMKLWMGGIARLICNSALGEGERSAIHPGCLSAGHIRWGAGWAEPAWTLWRGDRSLAPPRNWTKVSQMSSPSIVIVLTMRSFLPFWSLHKNILQHAHVAFPCVCESVYCFFSRYLCACVNGERDAHMNMTFPLNRTGSFALQFFIGLPTQVSIFFCFSWGSSLFIASHLTVLVTLSHCHCNYCRTLSISEYDKRTDFKWE